MIDENGTQREAASHKDEYSLHTSAASEYVAPTSEQLDAYARLLVGTGVALQPGQELVVRAPIERVDFVRRVVRHAYDLGASHVTTLWDDDALSRLEYESVPLSYFEKTPAWKALQLNDLATEGAAFLFLEGSNPMALRGVDPAKPAAAGRARNRDCRIYREGMDYGRNAWCIAGVATQAWADHVFPDQNGSSRNCGDEAGDAVAVNRLWSAILATARADGADPTAAWKAHNATFEAHKRWLNEHAFTQLIYRSANGTNLRLGLNPGHIWEGGSAQTSHDAVFPETTYFPNMPTEEVFTTPDRMSAEGIVFSALPLAHDGRIVRDFWLRFEGGAVVDYDAREGRDVLQHILATDENACRLGECALISKNTPIRRTGLLFYSTLFDENASCHLALGTGFPECIAGGLSMNRDELIAAGVNHSDTHVDFMIGADDLHIAGVTASGEEIDVFVDGQWAWETQSDTMVS